MHNNLRPASYVTSSGITIPHRVLERVKDRLYRGDDWQTVGQEELRDVIPEGPDDELDMQEVISFCDES